MKKYRIEIGLSIILFISVVVLIVNIIIKANNGGKDVTGEEKYTLPSSYNGENADELYDRMKAISDDIFKKYFIKTFVLKRLTFFTCDGSIKSKRILLRF